MLDKFSEMVRGNLSKMERLKIVALVTIEVYIYIYIHTHYTLATNTIHTCTTHCAGPCSRHH